MDHSASDKEDAHHPQHDDGDGAEVKSVPADDQGDHGRKSEHLPECACAKCKHEHHALAMHKTVSMRILI